MISKRVFAYIFDLFIAVLISTLIFRLPIFNDSYDKYVEYSNQQFNYLLSGGSSDVDEEQLLSLEYNLNVASLPVFIIRLGVLIIYFGVIPFLWNGQTLGKKIFHIKVINVIKDSLDANTFMLRSILVSNFIPNFLSVLCIKFCTMDHWEVYSEIISFIQSILIFFMLGIALFRDDGRGLHDIICHTAVVSTKENKE